MGLNYLKSYGVLIVHSIQLKFIMYIIAHSLKYRIDFVGNFGLSSFTEEQKKIPIH